MRRIKKYSYLKIICSFVFLISFSQLAADWSAPSQISSKYASQLDLAVDKSGNAVCVWQSKNSSDSYVIQSSSLHVGKCWSPPNTISATGGDSPKVAVDCLGNAIAMWSLHSDGAYDSVQSAALPFSGSWSPPITILPITDFKKPFGAISGTALGINAEGTLAVAVWGFNENYGSHVLQGCTRSSNGQWSTPSKISPSWEESNAPQVAVDINGNAVVVSTKRKFQGVPYADFGAVVLNGRTWGENHVLSDVKHLVDDGSVAIDNQGNAIAIWSENNGSHHVILASCLQHGGAWEAPQLLSDSDKNASIPVIAMNGNGRAIAIWVEIGTESDEKAVLKSRSCSFGHSWEAPLNIYEAYVIRDINIAVDDSNCAVALWVDPIEGKMQSSSLSRNGIWGPVKDVFTSNNYFHSPLLEVDGSGNAVAVWFEGNAESYTLGAVWGATLPFESH